MFDWRTTSYDNVICIRVLRCRNKLRDDRSVRRSVLDGNRRLGNILREVVGRPIVDFRGGSTDATFTLGVEMEAETNSVRRLAGKLATLRLILSGALAGAMLVSLVVGSMSNGGLADLQQGAGAIAGAILVVVAKSIHII